MDNVVRARDLRLAGVSQRAINTRTRPGGPWQHLMPGILLLTDAEPTRHQRLHAALAYAGPDAVITGVDALREQGLPLPEPDLIHVLQGANQRLSSQGIVFERTTRPPRTISKRDLTLAEPHRAALDAARRAQDPMRVFLLLGAALKAGLCSIAGLTAELDAGSRRGAAVARQVLHALAHQ